MKIVLVSDIHLGVKNDSEFFLNYTKRFFLEEVYKVIQDNKAEVLCVLGDLFDKQNTTNVLVKNVAIEIVSFFLDKCPDLQIKLLVGNHDIYYKTTLEVSSINIFKRFDARVEVINTVKEVQFDSCKALFVPWLVQDSNNYKEFFKHIDQYENTGKQTHDLCLGHFSINGFEIIRGTIEDRGISRDKFKGFGQVFSGHFHLRRNYDNIQYLGCPYEITWNDYGEEKGITIFDTETRDITFIPNTISPKHKLIKVTSILLDKTIVKDSKGNMVKLIIDKVVPQHVKDKIIDKLTELSFRLDIIDETEIVVEDENVSVDANLQANTKAYLDEYVDKIQLRDNIDKTDFKLYMAKIHDSVENKDI